ncbi:MAG: efflux RND transporter permease subunit [Acidobacteriota bacterium]
MKKIITAFVRFPFYSNLIVLFLVVAGVIGLLSMNKSFFPERSNRDIVVSMAYPGASPKEMEEGITTRIEEAVRSIVGILEMSSTSSENFATVRITTTGEFDIDSTLMEVKNAVDSISSFPVSAEKPVVFKQRASTRAMFLGLSGDVDLLTIKKYADQIEYDLLTSGMVSQINIFGFPQLELSVEVPEEVLRKYNITFDNISRAIALNNRDLSAGLIKSKSEEILIRLRSRSVKPEDIGSIVLRANDDGSYLRIRDIADLKLKFADVSNLTLMNGKKAVYITIEKLANEDLEEISTKVKAYIEDFNTKNKGVKLEITFDFLDMLGQRLNLLYRNGGIGLLLVVISLGLFLSFRLSLWVAWGIPASFLGMFIVAAGQGITVNMISLFGMILVIGILVDDGIVIAENIFSHFEKGKSPKKAAIDGTMEVLPAVTTSITTTIIAFSPLMLLEGMMEFMYEMAFVVIFSLLFSLFEAFLVLPAHIGKEHILRSKKKATFLTRLRGKLDEMMIFMRNRVYAKTLKIIIEWKWVAVVLPVALLLITVGLFRGNILKATFFPSIPFDSFIVNIAFKPGTGEEKTMKYLKDFEQVIWDVNNKLMKEQKTDNPFISNTFLSLGNSFDGQERGAHAGNVNVMLKDMEGREISSFDIAEAVRKKIGIIREAEKFSIGGRNRWGKPVSISLLGKDLDELEHAKIMMMEKMGEMASLKNVADNNAIGRQEVLIKLKPRAYFLGLDRSTIANQIRQGFFGGQAQRLQSGKDEIRVWVRFPKEGRENLGKLDAMKVKTLKGYFPLRDLVDYEIKRGPVSIQRFNSSREIRVEADLVDPYEPVPPILEKLAKEAVPEMQKKFPGIKVLYQGQRKESDRAQQDLGKFYGLAFAMIVIVLMIHFKSFSQPFIILMMIPLAWIGAAWGHMFEGIPISMLSAWGMVALSGVIINDAVVFLSKYNSNLLEGDKVEEAVFNAGISRFRPIVLTSITTVLGLYPIVLEKSFQAQFLKPMAISLAYGVLVGTAFLLILFPSLILILNDIKFRFRKSVLRKKIDRESVERAIINSKIKID